MWSNLCEIFVRVCIGFLLLKLITCSALEFITRKNEKNITEKGILWKSRTLIKSDFFAMCTHAKTLEQNWNTVKHKRTQDLMKWKYLRNSTETDRQTHTTILWKLYRSTCVNHQPKLENFAGAKFYCSHALLDRHQHSQIREKMPEFSMVVYAIFTAWAQRQVQWNNNTKSYVIYHGQQICTLDEV